ncbi:hypothetical protein QUB63_33915 [Microcoleus sp. ARI1-B5]|uniref:hypothetical protein n=1 Tax=unclassified Microcoleus TaxID=2642155 RepID=UPI002FD09F74
MGIGNCRKNQKEVKRIILFFSFPQQPSVKSLTKSFFLLPSSFIPSATLVDKYSIFGQFVTSVTSRTLLVAELPSDYRKTRGKPRELHHGDELGVRLSSAYNLLIFLVDSLFLRYNGQRKTSSSNASF